MFSFPEIISDISGILFNLKDSRMTWNYFCLDGEAVAAIICSSIAYKAIKSQLSTDPNRYIVSKFILVPQYRSFFDKK